MIKLHLLWLLFGCKRAAKSKFGLKCTFFFYLAYSFQLANIKNRAESSHAYIKRYLGAKKTEGDLLETIAGIEAGIEAQISNIVIKTA